MSVFYQCESEGVRRNVTVWEINKDYSSTETDLVVCKLCFITANVSGYTAAESSPSTPPMSCMLPLHELYLTQHLIRVHYVASVCIIL